MQVAVQSKNLQLHSLSTCHVQVVLSDAIKHPYGIAVFENNIYWSDWTGKEIQKCNKFTGKDRHIVIREKNNNILGIHIYHPAMMNSSVSNTYVWINTKLF